MANKMLKGLAIFVTILLITGILLVESAPAPAKDNLRAIFFALFAFVGIVVIAAGSLKNIEEKPDASEMPPHG